MTSGYRPVPARAAGPGDLDAIVGTLTTAFFHDPLWGPVFPDEEHRAEQAAAMWRLYATSALRYPWSLVTEHAESVALWIPPGGTELTADEEAGLEDLLADRAGARVAADILRIGEQLEEARPADPHFYLTLLGTHDDHRGKGLGMGLVAAGLARVDELGAAAYLESSNPANNARYERAGFTVHGRVTTATGHVVTTMWRAAR
jgi:GNAT superfamily N-acetyltransferase